MSSSACAQECVAWDCTQAILNSENRGQDRRLPYFGTVFILFGQSLEGGMQAQRSEHLGYQYEKEAFGKFDLDHVPAFSVGKEDATYPPIKRTEAHSCS